VLLVVRCAEVAHKAVMPMYMLKGSTDKLLQHFDLQDELDIVFHLTCIDFKLFGGRFAWTTKISGDYHSKNIGDVSYVVHSVLEDGMDPKEAFQNFASAISGSNLTIVERFLFYNVVGRSMLLVLIAFTATMSFFQGDIIDGAFAIPAAVAAALVLIFDTQVLSLYGATDFACAFVITVIAETIGKAYPDVCSSAITLGTMFWFYYGCPLVLGLLEVFDGYPVNGVVRFTSAVVKTVCLAIGASLGSWVAGFYSLAAVAPPPPALLPVPRIDRCVLQYDKTLKWVYDAILFPVCAICGQMQLRVGRGKIIVTLMSQLLAYWSQVLLQSLGNQNSAIINFAPAYLCTLFSYVGVAVMRYELKGVVCEPFGGWWDKYIVPAGRTASPWSVTFPAIYLLVPGSTIFKSAFAGAVSNNDATRSAAFASLNAAFFVVGISMAMGIKLAAASYAALLKILMWCYESCCYIQPDDLSHKSTVNDLETGPYPQLTRLDHSRWPSDAPEVRVAMSESNLTSHSAVPARSVGHQTPRRKTRRKSLDI